MKVIIAEKPSVGTDIAKIVGANKKEDGYYVGNGYSVTWSFGHLFSLAEPEFYDPKYKSWSVEHLPIIPNEFQLILNPDADKQFKTIKRLLSAAELVINAGDSGREGELIQRYILKMSEYKGEVKRLWFSSCVDETLKKAMNNLLPSSAKDNLYFSAKARNEADWIVGMSATRALTFCTGSEKPLSLGRVQTPVLAMICQRFLENRNFVPIPYFVPQLFLTKDGIKFSAKYKGERLTDKIKALEILKLVGVNIKCTHSTKEDKNELQPLLFDLTSLQAMANKKFGFTAQHTLDVMQKLYETHKVLTYPRTDSKYLTEDIYKTLPTLFNKVKGMLDYGQYIDLIDLNKLPKRSINNEKVTDHHAIIPTGVNPSGLSSDEMKIFDLVTRRFIAAFSAICKKNVTTYQFNEGNSTFGASGTVILAEGWRIVEKKASDDEEEQGEDNQKLPLISMNEMVDVAKKELLSEKTPRPNLFNEATLLKSMETCGKMIEDEELADAIKENGIGTPATRASIIETLVGREYILRDGKKLLATPLGISVYEQVKDLDISSPILTGKWEQKLNLVANGKYSKDLFNEEIAKYSHELVESIKKAAAGVKTNRIVCPKCNIGSIIEGKTAFGCNRYREGCDFRIWKEEKGTIVTLSEAKRRIACGEVNLESPTKKTDEIGSYDGEVLRFGIGQWGPYIKYKDDFVKLPDGTTEKPSLEESIRLVEAHIEAKLVKAQELKNSVVRTIGKHKIMLLKDIYYVSDGKDKAKLPKKKMEEYKGREMEYIKSLKEDECKDIIKSFLKWLKDQKSK